MLIHANDANDANDANYACRLLMGMLRCVLRRSYISDGP